MCLTDAKLDAIFPIAPSTERRRLKALPPGSRFGEGRSGELDEGDTDSVHFFLLVRQQDPAKAGSCGLIPASGGAHPEGVGFVAAPLFAMPPHPIFGMEAACAPRVDLRAARGKR